MKYLENQTVVDLMIWETNPRKRNLNNKITFLSSEEIEVNVGDVIIARPIGASVSSYEVLEILEKRPAALTGKIHYTVYSNWKRIDLLKVFNSRNKLISNQTQSKAIKLQEAVA